MSKCAFCGYPDSRHRILDAINERIKAGEPEATVLADYGFTRSEVEALEREVYPEVWVDV